MRTRILTEGVRLGRALGVCGLLAGFGVLTTASPALADEAVDGTTGLPLGGIGTGAIKFRAHDGAFAITERTPCALDDFQAAADMKLRFFADRGGTVTATDPLVAAQTAGRAKDDAIYPLHQVDFGELNGVTVTLTASSPFDRNDIAAMTHPAALFEFVLTNTQATEVDVALGFQIPTSAAPHAITSGFAGGTNIEHAVVVEATDGDATISVGHDAGFGLTGVLDGALSGNVNTLAAKVTLAPNAGTRVRFVFSWYNAGDPERYFYTNAFPDAESVAASALSSFEAFQTNASELVTRMRASNLPDWLENDTLNTLVNLTNNSVYTQDGRYCHTEGEWNINGTMDQMWHARYVYIELMPSLVWQELHYWARTQKTSPSGQIHHDFGTPPSVLVDWDDQQHGDYRDIDKWVDLNAAFIISLYEVYTATGDKENLDALFPYAKKAAQRIFELADQLGSTEYPGTFQGSENSYDAGGNPDPFNSGIALVAYRLIIELGNIEGDTTLNDAAQSALELGTQGFQDRYLTNNFPSERIAESVMSAQWLAYFLKLGELFPTSAIDYAVDELETYYQPATQGLGFTYGSYDEWTPYLLGHFGGLLLQTDRTASWKSLRYDAYERAYLNRNWVFNQPLDILPKVTSPNYLATSFSAFNQYISTPIVWRDYADIVGYRYDKSTGELWLEPHLDDEMDHAITNALVILPDTFGSIDYTESGDALHEREWTVRFDSPVSVSAIHLMDRGGTPHASVDGHGASITTSGTGHAAHLDLEWTGDIGPDGVVILTSDDELPETVDGGAGGEASVGGSNVGTGGVANGGSLPAGGTAGAGTGGQGGSTTTHASPEGSDGCGCRVSTSSTPRASILSALLLAFARRRRRRGASPR